MAKHHGPDRSKWWARADQQIDKIEVPCVPWSVTGFAGGAVIGFFLGGFPGAAVGGMTGLAAGFSSDAQQNAAWKK